MNWTFNIQPAIIVGQFMGIEDDEDYIATILDQLEKGSLEDVYTNSNFFFGRVSKFSG